MPKIFSLQAVTAQCTQTRILGEDNKEDVMHMHTLVFLSPCQTRKTDIVMDGKCRGLPSRSRCQVMYRADIKIRRYPGEGATRFKTLQRSLPQMSTSRGKDCQTHQDVEDKSATKSEVRHQCQDVEVKFFNIATESRQREPHNPNVQAKYPTDYKISRKRCF